MNYEEHLDRIPLYLSGRMGPDERAAFEALAGANAELRREIEDLRPVFGALNREFSAANETQFSLSAARRAELRRDTSANVVSFPASQEMGGVDSGMRRRLVYRRVSVWAGIAAAVLLVAFFGLEETWQAPVVRDLSTQAASNGQLPEATVEQPQGGYVYRPGYGLDVSEGWRARGGRQTVEVAYASLAWPASVEGLGLLRYTNEWRPAYLGLDGPRPQHESLTLRGPGAI